MKTPLKLERLDCSRGAPMGRNSYLPVPLIKEPIKMRMVRLRFSDGDYDQGGAYWGNVPGTSIYRAVSDGEFALQFTTGYLCNRIGNAEVFVRASCRKDAKAKVRALIPTATFYR